MKRSFVLLTLTGLAGIAAAGACGSEDTRPPPKPAASTSSGGFPSSSTTGGGGDASGGHGGAGAGGAGGESGGPLAESCSDGVKNGGESGVDCGGACTPCEAGVGCLLDADCYSKQCKASLCAAAACDNGVQDGDETDIDCGGGTTHHGDNPSCGPCSDLLRCAVGQDCESRSCVGGKCLPESCSDGVKNGTETGSDCGGICSGCEAGSPCAQSTDCLSNVCEGATCLPATCIDGVRNGGETDIDCGGMCSSKCPAGQRCGADADCSTSLCSTTTHRCVCPALMVIAPVPGGGSYCIDAYEVSKSEYNVFVVANPVLSGLPPACAHNIYQPSSDWPSIAGKEPVHYIDWCDAYAYCLDAGKHLCGAIGGGASAPANFNDASGNEWFNACTGQGVNEYPYGDAYLAGKCTDIPTGPFSQRPMGAEPPPSCEGGVSNLYNMSGDVAEWENSCDASGNCRVRGGSRASSSTALRCDGDAFKPINDASDPNVGFRCCL